MRKGNNFKQIYLDHAATTSVDAAVLKKMQPYFSKQFGNASSFHLLGEKAKEAIETARKNVAEFLACQTSEVFFTGSATEANNWIFWGLADIWEKGAPKPHVIISAMEHKSVLEPARILNKRGLIELTILPVDKEGLVGPNQIKQAVKENTRLISIMFVNNEIGTIQPIKKIRELIKEINQKRQRPIIFHTDAVQAINYLDCRVEGLGVDALSFSGHKIYGPKGVGVFYLRHKTAIKPFIYGGGHESGMRSGTENVPAIVGLGEAVREIKNQKSKIKSILGLRNRLIEGILKKIPRTKLNGSLKERLPNNVNISFEGAEGESIIMDLMTRGVYASTASACASHTLEPSHVLMALGFSAERAHSSVRFTLGWATTKEEIDYVLEILPGIIERLRKISGR